MKKAIAIICLAATAIMLAGCSGKAITLPNVNTSSPQGTTESSESSVPETSDVNSSQAETTASETAAPETTKVPETTTKTETKPAATTTTIKETKPETTTKAPETKPAATTTTVKETKPEATTTATTKATSTTKKQETPKPVDYITFSDGTFTLNLDSSVWADVGDQSYEVLAMHEEGGTAVASIYVSKSTKSELGDDYTGLDLNGIGKKLVQDLKDGGCEVTYSSSEKINGSNAYHIIIFLDYDQHTYMFASGNYIYTVMASCYSDPNGNAQNIIKNAISGFSIK